MILVSLFVSLAIVFSILTLAVSEVLLFGTPQRPQADRSLSLPLPMPRTILINQDIELTADSGVFIVS